jgi:hypothetical protein
MSSTLTGLEVNKYVIIGVITATGIGKAMTNFFTDDPNDNSLNR